jgi:site-specific recombinase XerD
MRAGGDTETRRSRRALAMPQRCVDALSALRDKRTCAHTERAQCDCLVFTTGVGTPLDAHNVRRDFRKVAEAAGLTSKEWTPRELRHSFVSLLSDDGMPIEQIARLVGHTGTVPRRLSTGSRSGPSSWRALRPWTASSGGAIPDLSA